MIIRIEIPHQSLSLSSTPRIATSALLRPTSFLPPLRSDKARISHYEATETSQSTSRRNLTLQNFLRRPQILSPWRPHLSEPPSLLCLDPIGYGPHPILESLPSRHPYDHMQKLSLLIPIVNSRNRHCSNTPGRIPKTRIVSIRKQQNIAKVQRTMRVQGRKMPHLTPISPIRRKRKTSRGKTEE